MSYREFVTVKKIATVIAIVCLAIVLSPFGSFVMYAMRDGIGLGIDQFLGDVNFWSVMLYVVNIIVMFFDLAIVARIGSLGNTTREQYQKFSENLFR